MTTATAASALVLMLAAAAEADVRNLGGVLNTATGTWNGLASLETVPVGNAGNASDDTGYGSVSYSYNIGKYEVTAGQYTAFLNAVAATDPYGLYSTDMWSQVWGCKIRRIGSSGSYTYTVASDWANRPVNYVSFGDAARFANWVHNGQPTGAAGLSTTEDGAYYLNGATSDAALMAVTRKTGWRWALATENEWYKAAYYDPHKSGGPGYWDYATGSNAVPNYILSATGTNGANFMNPNNSPYYRTEVGAYANSDSPYGTFDQTGNVVEWTEGAGSTDRITRGGSYGLLYVDVMSTHRDSSPPTGHGDGIGFRLVETPEPATLSLLALGGATLIARRRKAKR
jgi:formylglycine-generating enzyme required for sulfatase activity